MTKILVYIKTSSKWYDNDIIEIICQNDGIFFAYNEHTRKGYIILYRKYVQKYYSYSMGMSVLMSKTHVQLFTLHENFSQVARSWASADISSLIPPDFHPLLPCSRKLCFSVETRYENGISISETDANLSSSETTQLAFQGFGCKSHMLELTVLWLITNHGLKGSLTSGATNSFRPTCLTMWFASQLETVLVYIIVVAPKLSSPNPHASKNDLWKRCRGITISSKMLFHLFVLMIHE